MVRSKTCPSPGVGAAYSSMRKSDGFGSPTGRETRTTRLADCGMMVFLRCFFFVIARSACDEAIQSFLGDTGLLRFARNDGLSRDLRQRRVEGRSRARQVLKREPPAG